MTKAKTTRWLALAVLALAGTAHAGGLPVEQAVLTSPPKVPPPITRTHAGEGDRQARGHREGRQRLADGVEYTFWTFGGTVPGKFIRVREGDTVEFHLQNHPDEQDAAQHRPARGDRARAAARPATLHGAGPRVAVHLQGAQPGPLRLPLRDGAGRHARRQRHVRPDPGRAAGGPAAGRPRVLRDAGRLLHRRASTGEKGLQPFDMEKAIDEQPDLRRSSTARRARSSATRRCRRKVGETVRLFVGNGGPNLVSSASTSSARSSTRVYIEGGTRYRRRTCRRRWSRPAARRSSSSSSRCRAPTSSSITRIFRTFNKGALGMLKVDGAEEQGHLLRQGGRRGLPRRRVGRLAR